MRTEQLRVNLNRFLIPGLLVSLLVSCSPKTHSSDNIGGNNNSAEAEKDPDTVSGTDTIPGTDYSTPGALNPDSGNLPVPDDGEDEAIVPPVNGTGSPTDKTPDEPGQLISNGQFFIKSAGSMKCLAVPNNSRDNGVQLHQMPCDFNSNHMKFKVQYLKEQKAYKFSNVTNQKFLEVRNQSELIGGAIQQNDHLTLTHQMFFIEKKEDKRYYIRTYHNKLFMDVTGASVADQAPIQIWGDGNGISSVWIFEPAL